MARSRARLAIIYVLLGAVGLPIGWLASRELSPPAAEVASPSPPSEPAPEAPQPPTQPVATPGLPTPNEPLVAPGPSFVQLVKDRGPSVVHIQVRLGGKGPSVFDLENREGQGTGFIISEDGYIITNDHVVGDARRITVRLEDDREYTGRVIGSDPNTDIALIKIDADAPLPAAPLGDSDAVEIGEWVMAIGNPFGLDHTVTAGIVSAKGRRNIFPSGRSGFYDFIQTDASINPGNSGGPLFNMKGEVVGINSAVSAQGHGIGFAIPINMAKVLLPQLKQTGRVARSYLGVLAGDVSHDDATALGLSSTEGAKVVQVMPDSPAADAELRVGDVIVEFDGKKVKNPGDLRLFASMAGVGKTAQVGVIAENGKRRDIDVTMKEAPSAP